jgi:hypothetical protein
MVIELFIAGGSEIISFTIPMWLIIFGLITVVLIGQYCIVKAVTCYINKDKKPTKHSLFNSLMYFI